MNNFPVKITVAIPSYNSEKFIKDAIDSISNQTYLVNEIIVTDDDSKDSTINMIEELKSYDQRIKLFSNESNLGYQKNWNKCFEYCLSKYLVILHHDDILKGDCLEKQISFLNENPEFALVGGQEDLIDEKGNIFLKNEVGVNQIFQKGEIFRFINENGSYIPCSSVMFNMDKIKEVGYFDERYLATDELFWPKILEFFPIAILGNTLVNRRIHPAQTEYNDFSNKFNDIINSAKAQYHIADYEKDNLRRKTTLHLLKKKLARNCIRIAYKVFEYKKDVILSLRYLKVALIEYPQIFLSKFILRFIFDTLFRKVD